VVFFRLIVLAVLALQPVHVTLPTLLLAPSAVPSDVVVMVQLGGVAPLHDAVPPHPPPVHFWTFPFVSTITAVQIG
jgi:hypothetical protein